MNIWYMDGRFKGDYARMQHSAHCDQDSLHCWLALSNLAVQTARQTVHRQQMHPKSRENGRCSMIFNAQMPSSQPSQPLDPIVSSTTAAMHASVTGFFSICCWWPWWFLKRGQWQLFTQWLVVGAALPVEPASYAWRESCGCCERHGWHDWWDWCRS